MNELERELHYPLGDTMPDLGSTLAVAPGIRWVRMGLPFALNHINLWLLRDSLDHPDGSGRQIEGWTVVDTCISREESRAQWEQIFAKELGGLPVLRVICTHMHPDHIGLAAWLCERWTTPEHLCRLWISGQDYTLARLATLAPDNFGGGDDSARFFALHGMHAADDLAQVRARKNYFTNLVPSVPRTYKRLHDNDTVRIGGRPWRCISGYGHAPEHMALFCEATADHPPILIGGDMMLPRISTNVSVHENEPEGNPLAQFLHSIGKFEPLPADTLTLPAHGKPFTGLHKRIGQLRAHHEARLQEVMELCATKPSNAYEVVPIMFRRPLDLHQMTFALGEAIAHLNLLWHAGKLRRALGADGVLRFSAR
jgi:glyoxylase-like metal-dependent hydrolase (beta-lactamase superfamily II)